MPFVIRLIRNQRSGAKGSILGLAAIAALAPSIVHGQTTDGTSAEFFLGTAWNLSLPLTLSGSPQPTRIRARYSTRPFRDAPYYAVRFGHTNNGHGLDAELIHHKLYLENPAPPIERLEITHGYNLPQANLVAPVNGWRIRIGIGLVIAHPEGQIFGRNVVVKRGSWCGRGYEIAGVSFQFALGRRYALSGGDVALTAAPEVKLTAAFARLKLEQGTMLVPNIALHTLAGLGIVDRSW